MKLHATSLAGVASVFARAPRAYASKLCAQGTSCKHSIRHVLYSQHLHAILKHANPLLWSGLGKIGQAGDLGIVTSDPGQAPVLPGEARGTTGS